MRMTSSSSSILMIVCRAVSDIKRVRKPQLGFLFFFLPSYLPYSDEKKKLTHHATFLPFSYVWTVKLKTRVYTTECYITEME